MNAVRYIQDSAIVRPILTIDYDDARSRDLQHCQPRRLFALRNFLHAGRPAVVSASISHHEVFYLFNAARKEKNSSTPA